MLLAVKSFPALLGAKEAAAFNRVTSSKKAVAFGELLAVEAVLQWHLGKLLENKTSLSISDLSRRWFW